MESFPPASRVRKRFEFQRAQSDGNRVHGKAFVWLIFRRPSSSVEKPSEVHGPRLGITVSKRVCAKASDRNRIKRLLRETFRRHRALFPIDCDIIAIAKAQREPLAMDALLDEVRTLAPAWSRAALRTRDPRRTENTVANAAGAEKSREKASP